MIGRDTQGNTNEAWEALKKLDLIVEEMKQTISSKKIDDDLFAQVYSLLSPNVEEWTPAKFNGLSTYKLEFLRHGLELFTTAFMAKGMVSVKGRKNRKKFSVPSLFYFLASTDKLDVGVAQRVIDEVTDHRFTRNLRIFLWGPEDHHSLSEAAVKIMLLNKNITEELRLWLALQ